MRDLQSTRAMWLKGWLFLLIGVMSAALLLAETNFVLASRIVERSVVVMRVT